MFELIRQFAKKHPFKIILTFKHSKKKVFRDFFSNKELRSRIRTITRSPKKMERIYVIEILPDEIGKFHEHELDLISADYHSKSGKYSPINLERGLFTGLEWNLIEEHKIELNEFIKLITDKDYFDVNNNYDLDLLLEIAVQPDPVNYWNKLKYDNFIHSYKHIFSITFETFQNCLRERSEELKIDVDIPKYKVQNSHIVQGNKLLKEHGADNYLYYCLNNTDIEYLTELEMAHLYSTADFLPRLYTIDTLKMLPLFPPSLGYLFILSLNSGGGFYFKPGRSTTFVGLEEAKELIRQNVNESKHIVEEYFNKHLIKAKHFNDSHHDY